MKTAVTLDDIRKSVLAVPPLAWNDDFSLNGEQNERLVAHILSGGVRTLIYGGNANFYNLAGRRYREVCDFIAGLGDDDVWIVPSAGPGYDALIEQAPVLRDLGLPSAMILPLDFPSHPLGIERGIRDFVDAFGGPVILYIKRETYLPASTVGRLYRDGVVWMIKYAASRERAKDQEPYLEALIGELGTARIVSGFGEVPAVPHLRDHDLAAFTSGLVCIAPALSMALFDTLKAGSHDEAEERLDAFRPLEGIRDVHAPMRVLHEAIRLAGIAETGPILPLAANLEEEHWPAVRDAAQALLEAERRERAVGRVAA